MTRIRSYFPYFILHNSYFTVFLLSLAALRPILQKNLPCSDDVAFHLLRLTQLDHLLHNGILFSRWAPAMAQGYGYPIFNFYAPLSYYVAELFSLFGRNLHLGLRLTFAFGMLASGLAMYRFARDHFTHPAALVAAVAYMYAPYQAYDIFFRGNLAESFAWWLLPLALFSIGRLARTGQFKYFLATTLTYAAILLTHNAFALIFSPVLALYGLWIAVTTYNLQLTNNSQFTIKLLLITLSLLTTLALTAFFWLPALIERNLIHTDRLLVPPIFVYWGNFLTLSELFAAPRYVLTDLINPSPPRTLGLITALIALPSIIYTIIYILKWVTGYKLQVTTIKDPIHHSPLSIPHSQFFILHTSYFILITALTAFLTLAPARPLWDNLPLLEFVQFPWRFLGLTALTLAFLCGATTEIITSYQLPITNYRNVLLLPFYFLLLTSLIFADLFYLSPRYCEGLLNPTITDIASFERATDTIGTTAKGEYVPLTSQQFPPEPSPGLFSPLPQSAELHTQERTPLTFAIDLTATAPFTLTAEQFYYPGWQATIDGQPATLTPSDPYGLLQLTVPTGRHQIQLHFGETPLRRTVNWLSGITAVALLLASLAYKVSIPNAERRTQNNSQFTIHNSQFIIFSLLLFLIIIIFQPLTRQWLPTAPAPMASYSGGLSLLGYNIEARTMSADAQMPLTLWFKADRQPDANYQTFLRLVDEDGLIWSPRESTRPRIYRAFYNPRTWPLDQYAEDMHLLEALPGTPPGTYTIQLLVFDRDTLAPAALSNGRTELSLGTIQLTRPDDPFTVTPQYPAAIDFGEIKLIGYNLDREEADSGNPFLLTLFWETLAPPTGSHEVELFLVGSPYPADSGPIGYITRLPLVAETFDPQTWRPGDIWRAQHSFRLPASLVTDTYTWVLRFCSNGRCQRQNELHNLGTLAVTAPERDFVRPEFDIPLDTEFAGFIELLGATLCPPDSGTDTPRGCPPPAPNTLTTHLFWHPHDETPTSYRVFVQLLNQAGQPVAVSDQEPAVWTRPTSSWVPDEYITDTHTLHLPPDLPAGTYTLITGLYDPATSQRLTNFEGQDTIIIDQLTMSNVAKRDPSVEQ